MSHFSLIKIKIKNPNINLLRKAVLDVIKELKGTVVSTIYDASWRARGGYIIAFKTNVFRRGVGIKVDVDGNVKIEGDFYDIPISKVEELEKMITRSYTVHATIHALKMMGYTVQKTKAKEKIYIKAVARW